MNNQQTLMKLYNLPQNTKFLLQEDPSNEEFLFDHVDGMYSVCKDKHGNVIHFAAFTDVIPITNVD